MCKGLFSRSQIPEKQLEFAQSHRSIDDEMLNMRVGDQISFPISRKGSVTGRVSDLNHKFVGEKIWHTKTIKVEFVILIIRDK